MILGIVFFYSFKGAVEIGSRIVGVDIVPVKEVKKVEEEKRVEEKTDEQKVILSLIFREFIVSSFQVNGTLKSVASENSRTGEYNLVDGHEKNEKNDHVEENVEEKANAIVDVSVYFCFSG